MGVNKVEANGEIYIDLTSDSVTPETLAKGVTAHDASGEMIVGTLDATSDTTVGTWIFNEVLDLPGFDYFFNFVSTNVADSPQFHNIYSEGDGTLYYFDVDNSAYTPYENGVWVLPDWRTITITEEPTDAECIAWLKANATKQAEKDDSSNFEMPIIRFANFQDSEGTMCLSETNPYKFTVEILGGGALREGDLLQICVRRKYKWEQGRSKWKLRRVAQRTIEADDIGKRYLSIDVTLENIETYGRWLFRNDRSRKCASSGGGDNSIDTLSYIYFRIKRVTKYNGDGEECGAIFSNIEKVAKTYNPTDQRLTIK